ncbi:hypothetical protein DL93DRAFT_2071844, partial [Clavulina sp. PMI_390]
MFNAWRKAWAKEKESQVDVLASSQQRGASIEQEQPETTAAGLSVSASPSALDEVLSTSRPQLDALRSLEGQQTLIGTSSDTPNADHSSQTTTEQALSSVLPTSIHPNISSGFPSTESISGADREIPDQHAHAAKDEGRQKFEAAISANSAF